MDQVQQSVHRLLSELCADMSCGTRNLERAAHEAHRAILEWRRLKDVSEELRAASANQERKL
ncbi:MAG TPA: hypothetical protein VL117_11880 [Thermoleophilia bacterium]|nr:hypothetical protein [Thermoleophilia bacterium]